MFQIHFIIDLSVRKNISDDGTICVFVFLFILFLFIIWSKNGCFRSLRALWNANFLRFRNVFPYFGPHSKTCAATPGEWRTQIKVLINVFLKLFPSYFMTLQLSISLISMSKWVNIWNIFFQRMECISCISTELRKISAILDGNLKASYLIVSRDMPTVDNSPWERAFRKKVTKYIIWPNMHTKVPSAWSTSLKLHRHWWRDANPQRPLIGTSWSVLICPDCVNVDTYSVLIPPIPKQRCSASQIAWDWGNQGSFDALGK